MREEARSRRQEQIEDAAYRVLERRGAAGTTMLAIAREARASHETLYGWYGDKAGLFRALVARNARTVRALLEDRARSGTAPIEALARIGPELIGLLTHPRAIALNRAAAAEPGGTLALAIAEAGRDSIGPLIESLLLAARTEGQLGFDDPAEALRLYLDLLIGDLQHRRVIGLIPPPSPAEAEARAAEALARLRRLMPPAD